MVYRHHGALFLPMPIRLAFSLPTSFILFTLACRSSSLPYYAMRYILHITIMHRLSCSLAFGDDATVLHLQIVLGGRTLSCPLAASRLSWRSYSSTPSGRFSAPGCYFQRGSEQLRHLKFFSVKWHITSGKRRFLSGGDRGCGGGQTRVREGEGVEGSSD